MNRLAMAMAICVVIIFLVPQTPNIAKAYSCNSSSSGVSTSISGSTGSCSTSPSSVRSFTSTSSARCSVTSPNCSLAVGLGDSSSASTVALARAALLLLQIEKFQNHFPNQRVVNALRLKPMTLFTSPLTVYHSQGIQILLKYLNVPPSWYRSLIDILPSLSFATNYIRIQ